MAGPKIGFREAYAVQRAMAGETRAYQYTTRVITVPGPGSNLDTLSILDGFDFIADSVTALAWIASTNRAVDYGFNPPVRVQLREGSATADCSNRGDIIADEITGVAEEPRYFRQPMVIRAGNVIVVTWMNVAAVAYLVQLSLHGYQTARGRVASA